MSIQRATSAWEFPFCRCSQARAQWLNLMVTLMEEIPGHLSESWPLQEPHHWGQTEAETLITKIPALLHSFLFWSCFNYFLFLKPLTQSLFIRETIKHKLYLCLSHAQGVAAVWSITVEKMNTGNVSEVDKKRYPWIRRFSKFDHFMIPLFSHTEGSDLLWCMTINS